MADMRTPGWCSVCRSRFRGGYNVHASTAKHRRNTQPKRANRSDVNRALGIPRINVRRALADNGDDMQRIRKHRRRLPEDGPRKVVQVHRYWRRRAWSGWGALRRRLAS